MKQYVLWLILLHVCCCENLDYVDYHPESIPLQASGYRSPEYKEVMKNLCDNWHSPLSYLKKRGYMPANVEDEQRLIPQKENHLQAIDRSENYFFFPADKKQVSRSSTILLDNNGNDEKPSNAEAPSTEPQPTELPVLPEETKNDTNNNGIINKVKDKFLSIFSHKDKSKGDHQIRDTFDLEDPEFLENYYDAEYETFDKRIFSRSVPEKSTKISNSSNENILSNLTESEIGFIKSFINWFKQNKDNFKFLSSSLSSNITNTTNPVKNLDLKSDDKLKSSSLKLNDTRPSDIPSKLQNSTESGLDKKMNSSTKSVNSTSECVVGESEPSTTSKTTQGKSFGNGTKNGSASTVGKEISTDITIDLDINQKNGTGEENGTNTKCTCDVKIVSTTPNPHNPNQGPYFSDNNKLITKLKFLAHLHHMVDEVGKPPHKPLDLAKVQDIIDKSKKLPPVIMGGGKTTECAPLRLNDMSFDLEWNNMNALSQKTSEKNNIFDLPYLNQPQSLAAKFLQEVNSYPSKSDEYLKTPYADNFLDTQQSLPSELELPLKSSTKREVALPSYGTKVDIYSFPETNNDYENISANLEGSPKRRIKGRIKGRNRTKPKHKNDVPLETVETSIGTNDDTKEGTDFRSFDELNDIQFRVNDNDEEAISKFISNLNSPPEVFSFDVDKYLRSAQQNMEPKTTEFEFHSPETRTYYEFLESPAVENERLPLIEPPSEMQIVDKRSRKSPEKRDLLRQYIKGVSSALNRNFDGNCSGGYRIDPHEKLQRSPDLVQGDSFLTNNVPFEAPPTSYQDWTDSIKPQENNDFLSNYFLINDSSVQALDVTKQNSEVIPNDYSPQSLEIDLDLDKKFRDLSIGRNYNDPGRNLASIDSENVDVEQKPAENSKVESSDLGSMIDNGPY